MVALSHVQTHVPVSKHILLLPLLHHPHPHLYLLATQRHIQLQCQWHHILHPALSPVQILVSVRGLFFRPHRHSPWWDPRGSHRSPRRATQMTHTRWETTVTAMRARTTTTVLPRGMVSIQWKVSELTMHVLFIRLHTSDTPKRGLACLAGHTLQQIWRIVWKKWRSEEKSQETNVCCAVLRRIFSYVKFSQILEALREFNRLFVSRNSPSTCILLTIRHVYRSVWPAREAKHRFGARSNFLRMIEKLAYRDIYQLRSYLPLSLFLLHQENKEYWRCSYIMPTYNRSCISFLRKTCHPKRPSFISFEYYLFTTRKLDLPTTRLPHRRGQLIYRKSKSATTFLAELTELFILEAYSFKRPSQPPAYFVYLRERD